MKTTPNNTSAKSVAIETPLYAGVCHTPGNTGLSRHMLSLAGRLDPKENTIEILFMYGDADYKSALSFQPGGNVMQYAKQYMFSFYSGSRQTSLVPFTMYMAKDIDRNGKMSSILIKAVRYNTEGGDPEYFDMDPYLNLPGIINAKDDKYRDSLNKFWECNIWNIVRYRQTAMRNNVPDFVRGIIPAKEQKRPYMPSAPAVADNVPQNSETRFQGNSDAFTRQTGYTDGRQQRKQHRKELKRSLNKQNLSTPTGEDSVQPIKGAKHTYDYRTLQHVNKLLYEFGGRMVVNRRTNELEIEIIDEAKAEAIHAAKVQGSNDMVNVGAAFPEGIEDRVNSDTEENITAAAAS